MLTEHYVAGIQTPLKTTAAGSKDVSIFLSELQPLPGVRAAFKRSATAPNCLAVSETHIFAAQAEKAVVHVYNRERGNHESTIPFNEKITCLCLALGHLVLLLGTESGRIMAWELATGRLISTPNAHLQAVTCLAVDPTSNFLLSGSRDSNVLVWSFNAILSFSSSDNTGQSDMSPVQSLSSQRGTITALAVGHGHAQCNIVITASEDQSVIVWDYKKGVALGTYLLRGVASAVVLDKGDRGFYATYEDGSIQLIEFYANNERVNTLHNEDMTTPVQPGEEHVWKAEGQELGAGLSLALSWDGSRLLSGHQSGKIASWDVSKGSFMSVLDALPGTVNNLVMTPVQGLSNRTQSNVRLTEAMKPRISSSDAHGIVPGDYALSAQMSTKLDVAAFNATKVSTPQRRSRFQAALSHSSFPDELLVAGLAELRSNSIPASKHTNSVSTEESAFTKGLRLQNEQLLEQVTHLQKLQKASFSQLREKNRALSMLVQEQEQMAEIAKTEHNWNIVDPGIEWNAYQQRQVKKGVVNGKGKAATEDDQEMADGG